MDYERKYKECAKTIYLLTEALNRIEDDYYLAVKLISELPDEIKKEILKDPAFPDGINPSDRKYF